MSHRSAFLSRYFWYWRADANALMEIVRPLSLEDDGLIQISAADKTSRLFAAVKFVALYGGQTKYYCI